MRQFARHGRSLLVAIAIGGVAMPSVAQQLFKLDDVRGDDDGTGDLIYPNRDDLHRGDLDLVSLSAERRKDGVWFIVELAQPIADPKGRVTELGQTPMERIARNGFYTFNVDIYIDKDRVAGSGQVGTVPGRGVTVDRRFAWEKAVVLTPRPDIGATLLKMNFDDVQEAELRSKQGKVSEEDVENLQQISEERAAELVFFPEKVRVSGRRIEFLVPEEFLGGVPDKSWAYTVMVTGADLERATRPGQLGSDIGSMMVIPVLRGVRTMGWGIRGDVDEATPPIVDILHPDEEVQHTALADYDMVAGRLAAVPGVAPDGNVAVASSGEEPTPAEQARINLAATPMAPAAGKAPTEKRTVPARLRTLNQLRDEGLITEAEYNDLRRKILAEL